MSNQIIGNLVHKATKNVVYNVVKVIGKDYYGNKTVKYNGYDSNNNLVEFSAKEFSQYIDAIEIGRSWRESGNNRTIVNATQTTKIRAEVTVKVDRRNNLGSWLEVDTWKGIVI